METKLRHEEEASASLTKQEQMESLSVEHHGLGSSKSRRPLLWTGVVFGALLVGLAWFGHDQIYGASAQRNLARELAAAQAEGILTSSKDITATLRPLPDSQNAAPLAMQIFENRPKSGRYRDMLWDASLGSDEIRLKEIRSALSKSSDNLGLARQAASKPGFFAERDYSKGSLMLALEFAGVSIGADLLRVQAAILRRDGKEAEALEAFRQSNDLNGHMERDQMWKQSGASSQLREKSAVLAASWAWLHPQSSQWLDELRSVLDSWPTPTEKEFTRYTLALALETFDSVKLHSREDLGYSEPPDPQMTLISKFTPELAGRTKVVRGFRKAWAVMDTPGTLHDKARQEANDLFIRGLLSDPTLYQTTAFLGPGEGLDRREAVMQIRHRKALYEAVYEVLSLPRDQARKLTESTALSPVSGVPFKIAWSGSGFTVSDASPSPWLLRKSAVIPPSKNQWKESHF